MNALTLICLFLLSFCFAAEFRCGNQVFPESFVNDDFCDCDDGSDEPATSACSKKGTGLFTCVNKGHKSVKIPSSRAFDGVCDCCDASDEHPGVCKDICRDHAQKENQLLFVKIKEQEEGIRKTQEEKQSFEKRLLEKEQELARLIEEDSAALKKREAAQKAKAEKEAELKEAKDLLRPTLKEVVDQRVTEQLLKAAEEKAAELQREAELIAAAGSEVDYDPEGNPLPVSTPQDQPVVPPPTEEELQEEREGLFRRFMEEELDSSPKVLEIQGKKREFEDDENSAIHEQERILGRKNDIEKFQKADVGPERQFSYMLEQSYELNTPNYNYRVFPFKDANQGGTSVGNWEGWEAGYATMKFTHGQKCWGGPDRSLTINLECGGTTEILDAKEPNKCEYQMRMKTPGACSQHQLDALKAQLN